MIIKTLRGPQDVCVTELESATAAPDTGCKRAISLGVNFRKANAFEYEKVTSPMKFDPSTHNIGLSRNLVASLVPERPDPPVPVDGATIGLATMSENSPHCGEMHPDGDEILYLISGRANVVFLDSPEEDIEMHPGDGLVVPKGMWHRVDILEPCRIVYVTPGPNNEFRPLADDT